MKPSHILLPAALSLLVAACGAPETKSQTIDVSADEDESTCSLRVSCR